MTQPTHRIILLGASNLARGITSLVPWLQAHFSNPLAVLAALGHGRSYGMTSSLLGRELPGILDCGLWSALARLERRPAVALVTDVGNDLLYGASPAEIAGWVEQCLERLQTCNVQPVLTELPLERLSYLQPWQFRLFRTFFYPTSRLSFAVVMEQAEQLNQRLVELATRQGILLQQPQADWYGIDPIHIRRRYLETAWQTYFAGLLPHPASESRQPMPWRQRLSIRLLVPEQRRVLGFQQGRPQPACQLPDETTLAFF